ncbi:MAG: Mov34/MPN/PAD-1 family protein [Bacilli bacterium]|nr:Mov34/MPN/PAD-1 family protein [Bacilli bacterium]
MASIIKINDMVLDELIKHCNINPNLECGGYLYGRYKSTYTDDIITITGIYYERIFGTENRFTFSPLYKMRAINKGKEIYRINGSKFIGCYHSHGKYRAQFSDVDRCMEIEHYRSNKAALIYSPIEDKLIGDIITSSKISEARITVISCDEFDRLYFPTLPKTSGKVISLKKKSK